MNQRIKSLWVSALRSGEYSQTRSHLADEFGYCCLGVLCEVLIKDGVAIDKRVTKEDVTYNGERYTLPHVAYACAGLLDDNPTLCFNDKNHQLSSLNDVEKLPFPVIADLIEKQL